MIQIIDKRATGKTSRLLLLAKETGATIASANPVRLREKAHVYGFTDLKIVSYKDIIKEKNPEQKVLIDELELFVNHMLFLTDSGNLVGYTLTEEELKPIGDCYI